MVDLGFPEFTRYLKDLNTELATAILQQYPPASFRGRPRGSFRTARSISAQFLNQDGTGLLARELRAAFCYLAPGHTTKGIMSGPIAA